MSRADVLGRAPGQAAPVEPFAGYPDLLTPAHLARLLGTSEHTVREQCRNGELPAVKVGQRWYVPKSRFAEHMGAA